MIIKPNCALYYPSIEFSDYSTLWSAALLWDRIYRIVPKSYVPCDCENVKKLVEEGSIGVPIYPDEYAKEVVDEFLEDLKNKGWNAAALAMTDPEKKEYFRLHKDKVDTKLRDLIISKGSPSAMDDWLYVPSDFGGIYMTYLATKISEKNNLQLITDCSPACTGATYFKYDGNIGPDIFNDEEFEQKLACLIIRDFIPENILSIRPEEIIRFRERRKYERRAFVNSVKRAANQLSNCMDPKIIKDLIEEHKKDIKKSVDIYKKSADILNVTGWVGLESLSFPIFGEVLNAVIPASDPLQMLIISTTGIALGVIAGITSLGEKKRRLSVESDYSYLLHLDREWKKFSGNQKVGFNYLLWRDMEEFIND